MEFICYKKCGTCKKAEKYLAEKNIEVELREIDKENPTKEELERFYKKSGLPLKRFFNTSGRIYKELNLKDKLKDMPEDEQVNLLSTNGMLVKRPILEGEDFVLVGFKEKEWEEIFG